MAGEASAPLADRPKAAKKEKKDKPPQKPKAKPAQAASVDTKGITVKKDDDLGEWYQQMLSKGQFISYYDVSGCYILEPASYAIWEEIKTWFDAQIKTLGVRNCYYPIFISEDNLQKEKDHIEGFAAEVAWVTHGGKSKLDKPIAIRPTSETAMYHDFHNKIQSHRDLPLKRNQWNNVVRWEFRNPMPFIRSREFLWQEGHTAHLTEEEAGKEVLQILDYYTGVYEELLAVPVVKGRKTVNEQFPGAYYTTTIEGFIPGTGRGIQAATSHCLGQHFAKMYDITVEDPNAKKDSGEAPSKLHVWQNSWGLTTRSIGVMMLIHGDDKGAVIPPRVAEIQAIIIPVGVTAKASEADKAALYGTVKDIADKLRAAGVRVDTDLREHYNAGWKFNDWELRGVPLRIEFGPKDMAKGVIATARRDTGEKSTIKIDDVAEGVPKLLETMQAEMLARARKEYDEHRKSITLWDEILPALNGKNVVLIPHCLGGDCADAIKDETAALQKAAGAQEDARAPSMGAKSLCIPFEQPELAAGTKCLRPACGQDAQKWVQFGRSY
ncbi:prolyl-tRNA synthetase [Trichodelitschia bisporula]|uniref:proline--tRNA ligase n=1 Tax=Trichodelitschia bisporula TaxID=703511 RepID=A0A6G1IAD0_9PEZI|nr:prolyl-tRNA synthetase [Trichodelitschia bisporula]